MVKLGNNFVEKNGAKWAAEDGFDSIPLISPLDASQLQTADPEKVVVKTREDYTEERKKGKCRTPKISDFSVSITDVASERVKMALLVLCALAFLMCVVFLVMFKVYQFEQPCPDGFTYTGGCTPVGVYGYYPPPGPAGRGRLFTIINHYNVPKQTMTRSVSPWGSFTAQEKLLQQQTKTEQSPA
ncbi:neuronal vesicle trafficking-associated protein 1-like isoform X2 [Brachyhypopomus gauderio]|uniref:neuronal vesicle trafficking-associated protein 1-like isoform X2 n=1 Tax=Brachyhypopomus gauderio TaxID=698409 RepID=UPI00404380F6